MSFTVSSFKEFPKVFWTANLTELFERAAYYAMASFLVLYLQQIGLGNYWPSTLNGLLWFLVYFLPILSGSLADHFGFRRALILAFVLLTIGYTFAGTPVWMGVAELNPGIAKDAPLTASPSVVLLAACALLFIGLGGSIIKPCISGTVQKASPAKLVTLGFGLFYMVINVGSLFGRGVSYFVRVNTNLSYIFAVSGAMALLAMFAVLFTYEEPPVHADAPKKDIKKTLLNMVLVLRQTRFVVFLALMTGFAFLYHQVYNIIPLYLNKFVQEKPPVELYTMANPVVIVLFQLLITRFFGGMKPIRSIILGTLIIAGAMLINIIPLALSLDLRSAVFASLPMGGLMAIATVAMIAFGELFEAPRLYEFIGRLSPKGQEGLYMGYANLPMALGSLIGGPVGAYIFNDVMVKQGRQELGWIMLAGIGVVAAAGIWIYARWLDRQEAREAA